MATPSSSSSVSSSLATPLMAKAPVTGDARKTASKLQSLRQNNLLRSKMPTPSAKTMVNRSIEPDKQWGNLWWSHGQQNLLWTKMQWVQLLQPPNPAVVKVCLVSAYSEKVCRIKITLAFDIALTVSISIVLGQKSRILFHRHNYFFFTKIDRRRAQ